MSLRDEITAEMKRDGAIADGETDFRGNGYCTWWFPHKIDRPTKACRAELIRMEREGLAKADRSQSNNTRWLLTTPASSSNTN